MKLLPLAVAASLVLSGGVATASVLAGDQARVTSALPHGAIDDERVMQDVDCDDAQLTGPEATSTSHVTGDGKVSLDVLVLVDVKQSAQLAKDKKGQAALFAKVRKSLVVGTQSYAPLDIALKYDKFALLQPFEGGKPRERTDNAQQIIDLAKEQLGGERRRDVDVVYVVTDLDIQLPGLGSAVAGLADCIGGVALPDRAFAVGESGDLNGDDGSIGIGPVTFYKDFTAKIAAHEIGHLMGGHHHYQECGTAAPTAAGRGEPGPCTIMTNAVDFQTLPFSTLNGVVVRGHAERWATNPRRP